MNSSALEPHDPLKSLAAVRRRIARIERKTSETQISLSLDLDGDFGGEPQLSTGVGFFDHMLNHISRHGQIALTIDATGDYQVDDHHTVEDVGIVLGEALRRAVGDKAGMARYGSATIPMDESLVLCSLDFSGRGGLYFGLTFPDSRIGTFASELVEEFFRAVAINAGMTLHFQQLAGRNAHHIAEAAFKAFGRALDASTTLDPRLAGVVPSTKGVL